MKYDFDKFFPDPRLDRNDLIIVSYFAYRSGEVSFSHYERDRLKRHLTTPVTYDGIDDRIEKLAGYGPLLTYYGYYGGMKVAINPIEFFKYAIWLIVKEPDLLAEFSSRGYGRENAEMWVLARYVAGEITGKDRWSESSISFLDQNYRKSKNGDDLLPFVPFIDVEEFFPIFGKFHKDERTRLIQYSIINDLRNGDTGEDDLSRYDFVAEHFRMNEIRELAAGTRYLSEGTLPALPDKGEPLTFVPYACHAISLMFKGRFEEAEKLFTKALKIRNHGSVTKNIFLHSVYNFYLMLCRIRCGNTAAVNTYLKKNFYDDDPFLRDEIYPASYLATRGANADKGDEKCIIPRKEESNPLWDSFAHIISLKYRLKGVEKAPYAGIVPALGILRAEYLAICDPGNPELAILKEKFGGEPPFASMHLSTSWEKVFDTVEDIVQKRKMKEEIAKGASGEASERIVYVYSAKKLTPCLQKLLKSGAWSAPRSIPGKTYWNGDMPAMDQNDRMIRTFMLSNQSYYYYTSPMLDPAIALSFLVGSDKVLVDTGYSYEKATVEKENPYIQLTEKDGEIQITSNTSYGATDNALFYADKKKFVVVTVDPAKQQPILKALLYEKSFPKEALPRLEEVCRKISDIIDIRTSLFKGSSTRTEKAAAHITVRLWPTGDSFRGDLRCYPREGADEAFLPGEGSVEVYIQENGESLRVIRNLQAERMLLSRLTSAFDFIDSGGFSLSLEELLDVLTFCMETPEDYSVQWPRGGDVKIKGKVQWKQGALTLSKNAGWFDVEGEVKVDDGTLLKAAELIRCCADPESTGEFIKIGQGEYLRLSAAIRKQLSRLAEVTQEKGGHYRVSTPHAGVLGELVGNEGILSPGKEFSKTLEKIEEASTLNPEVPSKLRGTLREYQEEGFRWMVRLSHWGAGACLADDMGLGKTVQAIAFLLYNAGNGPSIVVAPASVVANWKAEIERFAPTLHFIDLAAEHDRKESLEKAGKNDVVVCSYGILTSEQDAIAQKKWAVACLDEAHTIKNRATKMSAAAMGIDASCRIILTGTPVQNHLGELWNLFQFINPGLLGGYDAFMQKYVLSPSREKARKSLKKLTSPFILRRLKSEVVEELPEKTEIAHYVDLTPDETAIYEAMRIDAEEKLKSEDKVSVSTLSLITKLRQAACSPSIANPALKIGSSKTEELLKLVHQIVEAGNNTLVFSQFTSYLAQIKEALDEEGIGYLYLDGSTPVKKRTQLVDSFQRGESQVFLISLKAGGLGLNLTEANYVILLDPWWNPAIEDQASDRAHRIGQKRNVTIYRMISRHTIEEKILRLHERKREISDFILEGTANSSAITIDDLKEMLQS